MVCNRYREPTEMSQPASQASETAEVSARIESIWVYPVKSCAGIALTESEITIDGLLWDRNWMVVDRDGEAITQREAPAMALIQPSFRMGGLMLRAPGMLPLHLSLDSAEEATRVHLWGESLPAYEMGAVAAQWFTDFLGGHDGPLGPLRLVRFDPEFDRACDPAWTGGDTSTTQFADGFGLLVTSTASLASLNERLAAAGKSAIDDRRLRPNIVLSGLDAHAEDAIGQWMIVADDNEIAIENVKPCGRCSIPDVDPDQGVAVPGEVSDILLTYRRDPRIDGSPSFGMNAVVRDGAGAIIRVGQTVRARMRFAS
jgi:uncharacterized protein YcbX